MLFCENAASTMKLEELNLLANPLFHLVSGFSKQHFLSLSGNHIEKYFPQYRKALPNVYEVDYVNGVGIPVFHTTVAAHDLLKPTDKEHRWSIKDRNWVEMTALNGNNTVSVRWTAREVDAQRGNVDLQLEKIGFSTSRGFRNDTQEVVFDENMNQIGDLFLPFTVANTGECSELTLYNDITIDPILSLPLHLRVIKSHLQAAVTMSDASSTTSAKI